MVASYLGLGSPAEPLLFANHAPRSDVHTPARKRRGTRTGDKASTKKKATKASNHTASNKDSHVDTDPNPSNTKQEKYGRALLPTPIPTVQSSVAAPLSEPRETSPKEFSENESSLKPPYTQVTVAANEDDHDDDFGQLCFDFEPQTSADNVSPSQNQSTMKDMILERQSEEDDYGDDFMDEDLLDLTEPVDPPDGTDLHSDSIAGSDMGELNSPAETASTSINPKAFDDANSSDACSKSFVSPVILSGQDGTNGDKSHKPIVRSPFPTEVRDRSPIIGLSSNQLLRTCFRVGEAINQSCQAAKTGKKVLIELYAKILSSERDHLQQRFTFHDLFHAKPPYIQATYAAAIWKGVQLYEYDSSRLLQPGRMCRCIGTMKRNGKDWVMTVLNMWEATWDDVQWVEGIVNS